MSNNPKTTRYLGNSAGGHPRIHGRVVEQPYTSPTSEEVEEIERLIEDPAELPWMVTTDE